MPLFSFPENDRSTLKEMYFLEINARWQWGQIVAEISKRSCGEYLQFLWPMIRAEIDALLLFSCTCCTQTGKGTQKWEDGEWRYLEPKQGHNLKDTHQSLSIVLTKAQSKGLCVHWKKQPAGRRSACGAMTKSKTRLEIVLGSEQW